jgi:hypothetical protein
MKNAGKSTDQPLLPIDFDHIAQNELPASSGFDFPIHFDFAALDHHLRLPTRFGNRSQFQKLIEIRRLRNGVISGQSAVLPYLACILRT